MKYTAFRIVGVAFALCMALAALAGSADAQSQPSPAASVAPDKLQQLRDLLDDPDVRAWLQAASEPAVPATAPPPAVERIAEWEAVLRDRFTSLFAAIPRFGTEFANATTIITEKVTFGRRGTVIGLVLLLIGLGYAAEWLFRRTVTGSGFETRDVGEGNSVTAILVEIAALLVFALASVGVFVAFDWPPLLRQIILAYLLAFLVYRVVTAVGLRLLVAAETAPGVPEAERIGMPPHVHASRLQFWAPRLKLFVGYLMFALATVSYMPLLAFSPEVTLLVTNIFGLGLLGMAIEMVWRRPGPRVGTASRRGLLIAYVVVLYLLWVAGFRGVLWIGIYALLLQPVIAGVGRAAQSLAGRSGSRTLPAVLLSVLIVRGARAVVISLAFAWLAYVWRNSPLILGLGVSVDRLAQGVVQGVVVLLVADLLWQLSKAYISYKLEMTETGELASSDEMARRARLRTLLPIFRNSLAAFIGVVAVLTVLSGLGVQIAPLIAGAGIFGVAIGFGSQTLVKDVLSGVFFMLDDAFRVGEYIQSGSYKGTVESFSLRSVRLRHHRGPVFTVPFGDLGAVQNMSRDWVIEKMAINVTYDTDVELARKLVKKIGLQLAEAPEFKDAMLEPLKMQGVDSFGDFAMVVRMKMKTKPGQQFTVKRRALLLIKKAFEENGIKIAVPTVQVSGGADDAAAAAASETMRMKKAAEAATAAPA